jgi:uncharacterized membrane protein YesL
MIDRALRDKLIDAYVALIPLILLNLTWFVVSLPIMTAIPATGGLFYATNKLAHGHPADWRTLLEGFRLYFWQSWIIGLANVVIIAIFASNFVFYSLADSGWVQAARVVVIVLALLWLGIQIYLFPLLIEQERPHVRNALRNALVIILKRPLFTLAVTVGIAILAVGTTVVIFPVWIFITASACALIANHATIYAIGRIAGKK